MDISLIIFFLGLTPAQDIDVLRSQWAMLNNSQKTILIKQFENEYEVKLINQENLPYDIIRKVNFRAFDKM